MICPTVSIMASALSIFWPVLGVMFFSAPEQMIPVAEGTSWIYNMTEEAGPGVRLADEAKREAGTLHATVVYRIRGARDIDGRRLLEFEMHRAGRITNIDLLAIDEHGVQCWARVDAEGRLEKLIHRFQSSPPRSKSAPPGISTLIRVKEKFISTMRSSVRRKLPFPPARSGPFMCAANRLRPDP